MRFTKVLPETQYPKIRAGEVYQVTGKDGSQFKTHAEIKYGVPLFKDGKPSGASPSYSFFITSFKDITMKQDSIKDSHFVADG